MTTRTRRQVSKDKSEPAEKNTKDEEAKSPSRTDAVESECDSTGSYDPPNKRKRGPNGTTKGAPRKRTRVATSKAPAAKPPRTSGKKSKTKLKQEGVDARKEVKEKTRTVAELQKALEAEQEARIKAEQELKECMNTKLEESQRMRNQVLDDANIRENLESFSRICHAFAADYARMDAMVDFLHPDHTARIIQSATGQDQTCCFATPDIDNVIRYVEGGGLFLLEAFLTHLILRQVFCYPLHGMNNVIEVGSQKTYADVLNTFSNYIGQYSIDEARRFSAGCVQAVTTLEDRYQEKPVGRLYIKQNKARHYTNVFRSWFAHPSYRLLRVLDRQERQQMQEDFLAICKAAGVLSKVLWTQNVHLEFWGAEAGHLQHVFGPTDKIIEPHFAMQLGNDHSSIYGQQFQLCLRPMISAREIGDQYGQSKIWQKAFGYAFSVGQIEESRRKQGMMPRSITAQQACMASNKSLEKLINNPDKTSMKIAGNVTLQRPSGTMAGNIVKQKLLGKDHAAATPICDSHNSGDMLRKDSQICSDKDTPATTLPVEQSLLKMSKDCEDRHVRQPIDTSQLSSLTQDKMRVNSDANNQNTDSRDDTIDLTGDDNKLSGNTSVKPSEPAISRRNSAMPTLQAGNTNRDSINSIGVATGRRKSMPEVIKERSKPKASTSPPSFFTNVLESMTNGSK